MAKRKFHRDFSHELGVEIMARGLLVVLAFLCALPAAAMAESTAPIDEQAVDPRALKIIQAMSDRLAGAKRLSFRARAVYDVPGKDKTPIYYATVSDVYFARPNTLRVVTIADQPMHELVYDGKQVAVFSPLENTLATGPAPGTIEDAIRRVEEGGVDLPFADVLLNDSYKNFSEGLLSAFVIGQSNAVGGSTTDVVSITSADAHAQLWIGARDHLPRQIWVTYTKAPGNPRHTIEFSGWRLNGPSRASYFPRRLLARATRTEFPASKTP
jgi:hypothetical protein